MVDPVSYRTSQDNSINLSYPRQPQSYLRDRAHDSTVSWGTGSCTVDSRNTNHMSNQFKEIGKNQSMSSPKREKQYNTKSLNVSDSASNNSFRTSSVWSNGPPQCREIDFNISRMRDSNNRSNDMKRMESGRDEYSLSLKRQEVMKQNKWENRCEGDKVIDMRKNNSDRYKKEIVGMNVEVEDKEMRYGEVEEREREKNKENSSIHGPRSLDVLCSEFHVLMKQLETSSVVTGTATGTATGAATGSATGTGAGSIKHIYSKHLSPSLPTPLPICMPTQLPLPLPMAMPVSERYQTDFNESTSCLNDQISSYQSLERMHHEALLKIEEQKKTISNQKNENKNIKEYDYRSESQIRENGADMIGVVQAIEKKKDIIEIIPVYASESVKCMQQDEEQDQLRSHHHTGPLRSKVSTNTSQLYERVEQIRGDLMPCTAASSSSSSSSSTSPPPPTSSSSLPLRNIIARNIMEGVIKENGLGCGIRVRQTAFKHIEEEGVDEGIGQGERIEGEGEETEDVMDADYSGDGDGEEKEVDELDEKEEAQEEEGESEESEDDSEEEEDEDEEEEEEKDEEEGSKIDESSDDDDTNDSGSDDDDDDSEKSIQQSEEDKIKLTRYQTSHRKRVSSIRQSFNDFLEADICNQSHQHDAAMTSQGPQRRFKERKKSNAVNDEIYDLDIRGIDDSVFMRPEIYREKYQSIIVMELDNEEENEEEGKQSVVGKGEVEEDSDDEGRISKLSSNDEIEEMGKERGREKERGDISEEIEVDYVLRHSKNDNDNGYVASTIQKNVERDSKRGKKKDKLGKKNNKEVEIRQYDGMKENQYVYDFDDTSESCEERKQFEDFEVGRSDKIETQSYTELDKEGEEGRSVKSLLDALREERCLRFRMSRRMQTSNDEVQ